MSRQSEMEARLLHRIRELEEANARLAGAARHTAEIVETAPDALLVVDRSGRIAFVNRRVRELFGHRREDLLGRPLDVLLPERYRDGHGRHLRHYFAQPKARPMGSGLELWAQRSDGGEFPVEISLSPIRLGAETLVACSIRDASERREIEDRLQEARTRAETATAEKTSFIAAASHDLRQPLQAAAIYLDLLSDETFDAERRLTTARKAKRCVDDLRALLDKVLHISKLDAGAITARRTDFRVQTLFDRLADHFGPLAQARGLDLRVRPSAEGAHSDPVLTGQILENFVSNALRYTETGGVLVACRRRGDRLRLQVWDTGVGIAEGELEPIFRAFHRAEGRSAATADEGIGLGLAIAGGLGALLDHPIEVRSRPGRGSRFELVVPRAKTLHDAPPATRRRGGRPRGVFLAVIDNNPAIVDALRTVLEVAGNQVVAATTIPALLDQLRRAGRAPDAVVTDFRLSEETTGLQTLDRVRREFGTAIPAVILTGDSSYETLKRRAEGGEFRVLPKPVDAGELLAEIQLCIEG